MSKITVVCRDCKNEVEVEIVDGKIEVGDCWSCRHNEEKFARRLSDFVNCSGRAGMERAAKRITDDHRTLQQSSMLLFLYCIVLWDKAWKAGYHDDRNVATCRLSNNLVTLMSESSANRGASKDLQEMRVIMDGTPYLPCI